MVQALVGLLGMLLWPAFPQSAPQQPPTFRSTAELVTIEVNVVGKDGRPLTGLGAGDFVVTLNGRPRPVRVVDYLDFSDARRSSAPPGAIPQPRVSSNANPTASLSSAGKTRVVLLIADDLSWRPGSNIGMMAAAQRWVATLRPTDMVGLATTSGLGPLVQPTTNRAAVISALSRVHGDRLEHKGRVVVTIDEALEIHDGNEGLFKAVVDRECGDEESMLRASGVNLAFEACKVEVQGESTFQAVDATLQADRQIRALVSLISSLKAASGLPLVILMSEGVPTSPRRSEASAVASAAAQVGAQFSVLAPMPDSIDMSDSGPKSAQSKSLTTARRENDDLRFNGINNIAGAVGAETFRVVGTADRFFEMVSAAASGFYRLGVEPPDGASTKVLTAKVAVSRSGATVRANTRAVLPASAVTGPPPSIDEQLRELIRDGGAEFAVPISVASAIRRDASGGRLQVGVDVRVPGTVAGPLRAVFGVVNESKQVVQAGQFPMRPLAPGGDYRSSLAIAVPSGRYQLRVAVADAAGSLGSVQHPFTARLTPIGPIFASDLLLSWRTGSGPAELLAMEGVPASAEVLRAELELYGVPAGSARLGVGLQLTRQSDGRPVVQQRLATSANGDVLRASADIRLGALEPGAYSIRATVKDGDADLGAVSAVFIKAGPAGATSPVAALPAAADVLAAVREDARQRTPAFRLDAVLTPGEIIRQLTAMAGAAKLTVPPEIARSKSEAELNRALAAVAARGSDPVAVAARAIVALKRKEFDIALGLFTRVIDLIPGTADVPLLMGAAYAATGHDPDALGAWQMGLADPATPAAWFIADADALARTGDLDSAISVLGDARRNNPTDPTLQQRYAELLLASGRFVNARPELEQVIRQKPQDESALFLLVAMAFADVRQPDSLAADAERFKTLATQYLAGPATRRELVTGWLAAIGRQRDVELLEPDEPSGDRVECADLPA